LSNDHLFQLKAPKVAIASVTVPARTIDIFDGFALTSTPSTALAASIPNQAFEDIAFSPDGQIVYSRDVLLTTPNRVRAFDITTVPATLLAEATVGTASGGAARRGVAVDRAGVSGYFCDTAGVQRFDADPASPTFMNITGFATTTMQPPDSLAISPDGQRVFVVGASLSTAQPSIMMVIDTNSMTEISTVPLTDVGSVLGMTQRGPVVVSPSGEFVATVSLGFHLPGLGPLSSAVVSVVHTSPGPTQYTEVAAVPLPRAFQDDLAFDPSDATESTLYTVDSDQTNGDVYLTTVNWAAPSISDTYITAGSVGLKGEGGVDTTPNGSYIYVATSADDTLRILDASSMVVVQSLLLTSSGLPNRLRVERR
jgi:WD40 repeat protein